MYPYRIYAPTVQVISLVAVQIEPMCGQVSLGTATAFFEEIGERQYLITNWHTVTGRNPHNGRTISSDGITPDSIKLHLHGRTLSGGYDYLNHTQKIVPVEYGSGSKWIMHNDGQNIDIAILELNSEISSLVGCYLRKVTTIFDVAIEIGVELFVVGFPMGLRPTGSLPIWKRGSVATEPIADANGERCFLIDAATRKGMSGSPVFVRTLSENPLNVGINPSDPVHQNQLVASPHLAFVGIYSGRMNATDLLEAQIGKVWRPENIGDILVHRRSLDFEERSGL